MSDSNTTTPKLQPPSLLKSAGLIAAITVASKFLGLVRDQLITHHYGASLVTDAYFYAFQIPSFVLVLLGGLGGPFHTATVSILSKRVKDEAWATEEVDVLVRTFWTVTGLIFSVAAGLVFLFAPALVEVLAHHASSGLKATAVLHLRWMTPMIVCGSVVGIFCGVSNVYHRFTWPSFAPSAINITLIIWLLMLGPDPFGYALCVSTSLGALLQVMMQLPDYISLKFKLWPAFDTHSPDLKTMGELFFPQAVGTTIGQINIYVAMFFISQLAAGGWTAFVLANRLIQLPIGVLTIALLVPLFPRFSRWAEEQNTDALRHHFKQGIIALWLASFPMIAYIWLVAEPGIALLFERGEFTAHDTQQVAIALVVLSLSVIPYMLRDAVTRVFYAYNDSKTPLYVGLGAIVINAVLNAYLVKPLGVAGIAGATVVVTVYNAVMLTWLSRRHIRSLGFRLMVVPTLKLVVAFLVTVVVTQWTMARLPQPAYTTALYNQVIVLAETGGMVAVLYTSLVWLLRVEELTLAVDRLRARLRR
ncbi:MAG: murein biosynthesis integral membrane protein MurJ [Cyanobacteria bacterium HKST-UBA05]|nr:murein biosynthesis integral membrane protein MurJ [Cyanobacteria bacterium HKST-UBA05]